MYTYTYVCACTYVSLNGVSGIHTQLFKPKWVPTESIRSKPSHDISKELHNFAHVSLTYLRQMRRKLFMINSFSTSISGQYSHFPIHKEWLVHFIAVFPFPGVTRGCFKDRIFGTSLAKFHPSNCI